MATEEKRRNLADHGNFTCSKKGQVCLLLKKNRPHFDWCEEQLQKHGFYALYSSTIIHTTLYIFLIRKQRTVPVIRLPEYQVVPKYHKLRGWYGELLTLAGQIYIYRQYFIYTNTCDGDWQNGTRCGIYDFALWRRKVVNVVVTWKRAPAVEVIAGRNMFSLKVELKESLIFFFHPCNLLLSIINKQIFVLPINAHTHTLFFPTLCLQIYFQ
jgi:hypothetical protein